MGFIDGLKKVIEVVKEAGKEAEKSDTAKPGFQENVLPISKRIQGKTPVCDGLYPHEVLVLSYAPKYSPDEKSFPGFWWYKYGIRSVPALLYSLKKRGYIEEGSVENALQRESAAKLKELLKKYGFSVSGKKSDLIKRLQENVSEDVLLKDFSSIPYKLTPKGEEMVEKYAWIPYIHANTIEDLDIWNLTDMVLKAQKPYRDVIWGFLNKESMKHAKKGEFGLYRNNRLTMATFVAQEERYETAFSLLCQVLAYDLSGLADGYTSSNMKKEVLYPYQQSGIRVYPGILRYFNSYIKKLHWDDETIRKNMLKETSFPLHFRIFSPEECTDIFFAEKRKDEKELEKIYYSASKKWS